MGPFVFGGIAFCAVFGAALIGVNARARLPGDHLAPDSKDAIKLATAVIGTLSALALGLLIASAKRSFDDANGEIRSWAGHVVLLDRVLSHYGPETQKMRNTLPNLIHARLKELASGDNHHIPEAIENEFEPLQDDLRELKPDSDGKRWLQQRALGLTAKIAEARWLRADTEIEGFPMALLFMLVFWMSLLFCSFGLLAPVNGTVVATFFVSALAVSGAMVLIIDMDHPYQGLVHASSAPLEMALTRLGRP
jgi:hypothetical protein